MKPKWLARGIVGIVATGSLFGPIGAAQAWEVGGNNRSCAGGVAFIPYKVERLGPAYSAFFPQRRIDRSPCYSGRQIIRVTYREFTGYNVPVWTLQEVGPGNSQPAAWYVSANQYLNVPVWEGGYFTKDIVYVDVKVEWFTDSWTRLSTMMIMHRNTQDYECGWGTYCWIKSDPYVGAYIQYS